MDIPLRFGNSSLVTSRWGFHWRSLSGPRDISVGIKNDM